MAGCKRKREKALPKWNSETAEILKLVVEEDTLAVERAKKKLKASTEKLEAYQTRKALQSACTQLNKESKRLTPSTPKRLLTRKCNVTPEMPEEVSKERSKM